MGLLGTYAASAAGGVTIEKPWMRLIIKARPAGGYFTLRNNTDAPIQLIGASSTACGMVMLHQTKEENGVEKMLPVKSVTVSAHGKVSFAPGGYHLMCMKPQSSMVLGRSVPVTLKFADGKTLTAPFPVKGPSGK
jgi:copper(I)-binding protein